MTMPFETRHCTLCGPEAAKVLKFAGDIETESLTPQNFSPRNLASRGHLDFMECGDCGILFADPILPESLLKKLYTLSDLSDEPVMAERSAGLENHIYQSYEPVLDRAVQRLTSRRSFIEVGGGTGFMLRYAVRRNFEQQIEFELSQDSQRKFIPPSPNAKFIPGTLEGSEIAAASASLICFFQMLDHVVEPKKFLQNVFNALESGGQAVCVVHNTAALPSRLLGKRSPILNVAHNYLFSPNNLPSLFRAVGFDAIEAFPIPNAYPVWYWLYVLPLPSALKRPLSALLKWSGLADKTVNLYAGNFAVIARKP